jgi:hypothetical protein
MAKARKDLTKPPQAVNDIACDITMTADKLERLRKEVDDLRRAKDVKSREMVRLAGRIGRKPYNKKGKEPTYINPDLPNRRPLSIPNHPTLAPGTKNNILDDLEGDLDAYEEILSRKTATGNGHLRKTPP